MMFAHLKPFPTNLANFADFANLWQSLHCWGSKWRFENLQSQFRSSNSITWSNMRNFLFSRRHHPIRVYLWSYCRLWATRYYFCRFSTLVFINVTIVIITRVFVADYLTNNPRQNRL